MYFNDHLTGIALKELVRRAISEIRKARMMFEVTKKVAYDGTSEDLFTTADTAAQAVYLKSLREGFPDFGIIAEENELQIPWQGDVPRYFTIDPLDGTKAFVRRQSHGVGTMIALVVEGVVHSAWVGDVNTQEIYGFRPGSTKVHRIYEYEVAENLRLIDRRKSLSDSEILLREPLQRHSRGVQDLVQQYKSHLIDGGSIGTWMARLWKGEVAAVVLYPGFDTPWDSAPVMAITERLGFKMFRYVSSISRWSLYRHVNRDVPTLRNDEVLIVHPSQISQLRSSLS